MLSKYIKTWLVLLFFAANFAPVVAQNIDYQIYTTRYYTGRGNSDFWSSDDPRWRVHFYDNIDGYSVGDGILRSIDNGLDGAAWDDPADFFCKSRSNANTTGWKVYLEGWEDDDCGASNTYNTGCSNNDEAYCSSTSGVLNFRNDPICNWNTYTYTCDANWRVEYRVYWNWANAPTYTSQPTSTDVVKCSGTSPISLITDASARYYKWQVSTNTACSFTSATWTDISGASGTVVSNSISYTPPTTAGTRMYRCLITSNCSADFNSKTTTSNCYRLTYMAYAPSINSPVCGTNTSIGTTQPFSVDLPPAVGAVANVSYTWSASPAGPAFSTTTGSSTNITFPTAGTFAITLTTSYAGCSNGTSTCNVVVNAPDCDFIYCDPSTTNTAGGAPNSPVSLSSALGLISSTRKHVRIMSGNYTGLSMITIPTSSTASGIIIEGGYVNNGGVWSKSTSAVTSLTFSGTATDTTTTIGSVIGIKAVNTVGLTLQDLTIATASASGQTSTGNGRSNYAIYLRSSSGYNIVRCNIAAGNASAGTTGASGNIGSGGSGGSGGGTGGCGLGNSTGGSGGNGGAGGAGGSGSGSGGAGSAGASGGYGGGGGNDNGTTTSTGDVNQSPGNWNGRRGQSTSCASGGLGGGWSSDGSCGNNAGQGSTGGSCTTTGAAGSAGSVGTLSYSNGYFLPGAGGNGSGGTGGGAGAGGGGGGGDDDGTDVAGDGGSGGSGGGGGGQGGTGGRGSGASFGIFCWNNIGSSNTITDCSITAGSSVATGGSGGTGGNGGNGAAATGASGCGCGDGNRGAAGGSGANGGRGGDGGKGSDGIMVAIGNYGTSSPTAPSNNMGLTANSSTSGGTVPFVDTPMNVSYLNNRGCTNSTIEFSAVDYTFSTSAGNALTDMSSGTATVLACCVDDGVSALTTLPFTFYINGITVNNYWVNSNSLMGFSNTTYNTWTNTITGAISYPVLMPWWDDLSTGNNGGVFSKTTGTAPNRVFTVEWRAYNGSSITSAYTTTFQVQLYEGTNVVKYVYGTGTATTSSSVGVAAASNIFTSITTSTNTSSISTANDANATWPGSGRAYSFTPVGGTWSSYGSGGSPVFDITAGSSSQTTASNPISIVYGTGSTGWKDVSTTTDSRTRLLYISTDRTPPTINSFSSPVCKNGQVTFGCTPNSPSSVTGYEWTVQRGTPTSLTSPTPMVSNSAAPTFTFTNTGTVDSTYQIKLRVRDQCCGWSKPVFATITVKPAALPGSVTASQTAVCSGGDPGIINSTTLPTNTVGTPTYQWFYQENCVGTWYSISTSGTSATYDPPTGLTNNRCYRREEYSCSNQTTTSNSVQISVNALPVVNGAAQYISCPGTNGNTTIRLAATGTGTLQYASSPYSSYSTTTQYAVANGSTTNYKIKDGNNCESVAFSVTAQATPTQLATANTTCIPCSTRNENRTLWLANGSNAIAIINDNSNDIGIVSGTVYVGGSSPLINDGTGGMVATSPRHYVITFDSTNVGDNIANQAILRLPITNTELTTTVTASGTSSSFLDNATSISTMGSTIWESSNSVTEEDGTWNATNTAWRRFLQQTGNGTLFTNDKYIEVKTRRNSEFWPHSSGSNSPLPIELVDFKASCINDVVTINWTTAVEVNNDYFTVQRSTDLVTYDNVAIVEGAGNSNTYLNYSAKDQYPLQGNAYYRLMQTDFNGEFEIFAPKAVACVTKDADVISIFPNPANDRLNVSMTLSTGDRGRIIIYNQYGQLVDSQFIEPKAGNSTYSFDLGNLAQGQYLVSFSMENKVLPMQRVIIAR